MHIVICDDEPLYIDTITQYVNCWAAQKNAEQSIAIRSFTSCEDMLEAWEKGMPIDILFIDIQMPDELSGMEAAKKIFHQNEYVTIVFITNYAEYACEGYQVNALRYLCKPIHQHDISECLDIVWYRWNVSQNKTLTIETNTQVIRLPVEMIVYFESSGHDTILRTADQTGQYRAKIGLSKLAQQLPKEIFVQCHRCYYVNLMYVRLFANQQITLSTTQTIPLSRKYSSPFIERFQRYYQGNE